MPQCLGSNTSGQRLGAMVEIWTARDIPTANGESHRNIQTPRKSSLSIQPHTKPNNITANNVDTGWRTVDQWSINAKLIVNSRVSWWSWASLVDTCHSQFPCGQVQPAIINPSSLPRAMKYRLGDIHGVPASGFLGPWTHLEVRQFGHDALQEPR